MHKPGRVDLDKEVEYGDLGDDEYERRRVLGSPRIDADLEGGCRYPLARRSQQGASGEAGEARSSRAAKPQAET